MLPYELELVMAIKTEDMFAFEYSIHQYFEQQRVRGEWFKLKAVDLQCIKEMAPD